MLSIDNLRTLSYCYYYICGSSEANPLLSLAPKVRVPKKDTNQIARGLSDCVVLILTIIPEYDP